MIMIMIIIFVFDVNAILNMLLFINCYAFCVNLDFPLWPSNTVPKMALNLADEDLFNPI